MGASTAVAKDCCGTGSASANHGPANAESQTRGHHEKPEPGHERQGSGEEQEGSAHHGQQASAQVQQGPGSQQQGPAQQSAGPGQQDGGSGHGQAGSQSRGGKGPSHAQQQGLGHTQQAPGGARPGPGHKQKDGSERGSSAHRQVVSASHERGTGHGQAGSTSREQQSRGHRAQQAPGSPQSAGATGAAASAPTALSAPSAGITTPVSPIATTPIATPPPQVAGASLVVAAPSPQVIRRGAPRHHAARRARHARGRVAGGRSVPVVSSAGTAAPGAVIPPKAVRADHTRRPRSPRTHSRPSPLVTTITRIVGVVPTPLRILIGLLFALALSLGARSRVIALRARRLERQRGELLEDVGLLQAALLPVPPARLGPVATSAAYRPAAGPAAGGDFYDVFALEDGRLAVIVGDVSGHGREALPHTALVRFTLRAYLEAGLSPRSAVQTAGAVLERQLGDSFVTVLAATYQPRDRTLVYACAGHPPPIVLGARSIAPITICSSPPIGAGMRTGTRQTIVSVPGRSQVCFHTDGVTEARVGSELFGEERLTHTLAELGPRATASTLLDRVTDATSARPDDMAACLLRVEGGADAPTVLVEEIELDREEAASERTKRFLLACGVERGEIPELVHSARLAAGRTGTVLLELRLGDGPPEIALQGDNITLFDAHRAVRRAGLGVSL